MHSILCMSLIIACTICIPRNNNALDFSHDALHNLSLHYAIHNNKPIMMDDMFLYYASHLFEHWIFCANQHKNVCIMMDDIYIYHAHTIFPLSLFCVGTHVYSSTSQSHELTKRALESNDALGSRGLSLPLFPSCKDYAHLLYLALTRLWAIYRPYAHTIVFTLHAMPLYMICAIHLLCHAMITLFQICFVLDVVNMLHVMFPLMLMRRPP